MLVRSVADCGSIQLSIRPCLPQHLYSDTDPWRGEKHKRSSVQVDWWDVSSVEYSRMAERVTLMRRRRDHYRHELRDGRKIVGIGITNDPERRAAEHRNEGHRFSSMNVAGPAVTQETAEKWEEQRLESYRPGHGGKLPRYNKRGS